MDSTKYLILIKGANKTEEVEQLEYRDNRYFVKFFNSPKEYPYSASSITIRKNPKPLPAKDYRITKEDGTPLFKVRKILDFGEYLHIWFDDPSKCYFYKKSRITIARSCLINNSAKECMWYFSKVSEVTGLKTEQGDNLLKKQYDALSYVGEKTALAAYLLADNTVQPFSDNMPIIFPFGFNLSQKEAVEKACGNQISIIEGPPGTGKTQTILNIIANILLRGKTVAVVSNNNSATQNVQEKLDKYGLSFFSAFLGNVDNKTNFIDMQSDSYPPMEDWSIADETLRQTTNRVAALSRELNEKLSIQTRVAIARQELADAKLEYEYFQTYYQSLALPALQPRRGFSKISAEKILDLWLRCELFAQKNKRPSLWFKIKNSFLYGTFDRTFFTRPMEQIIAEFQNQFYSYRIKELESQIAKLEDDLSAYHFPKKMDSFAKASMELLKAALFEKYGEWDTRPIFTKEDFFKNADLFAEEYPVVLSTTQSLLKSLSGFTYDYVIVDEASQVDVVTGALALSCAQNLVVVGDLKQLPNVVPSDIACETQDIFNKFNLDNAYEYSTNSLLSSICRVLPDAPRTLLREHYRCHPRIIDFCNRKFYQNQLIIMTEDHGEPDVLKAYVTVEGNHARGKLNYRQIDVILHEAIPELGEDVSYKDIGIISPYRAQKSAINEQVDGSQIEVDTVHKYQGREKKNIIVTTVDNQISEFVDNPNMLNVAVSRAEDKLRIIVSGNEGNENTNIGDLMKYIRYHNFEVVQSRIYSIFDLLYKQYEMRRTMYLAIKKRVSKYSSEDLMHSVIQRVLQREEFLKLDVTTGYQVRLLLQDLSGLTEREVTYATNPLTHVDFLIFNRMDKMPVLAIETDGYAFHKKGTRQHERDEIKNQIFEKIGISLIRFNTTGSQEEEFLIEQLQGIVL